MLLNRVHSTIRDGLPGINKEAASIFHELDPVVLTHDLKPHGLREGDIGTVVHRYSHGEAYEDEVTRWSL